MPRKMLDWVMRKKEIPEVLVGSVMSLYEGERTSVRVDSELSEEFELWRCTEDFCWHRFFFAVVVDVVS